MESEYINRKTKLIEYTKLHLISLKQDSEKIQNTLNSIEDMNSDEYYTAEIYDIGLNGQIFATHHLLQTMEEML